MYDANNIKILEWTEQWDYCQLHHVQFLFKETGEIIGRYQIKDSEDGIYLEALWVDPKFRGRTFGKSIFNHFNISCSNLNYADVFITVNKRNTIANKIYEDFGYIQVDQSECGRYIYLRKQYDCKKEII